MIEMCPHCCGLYATESGETFAGTPCNCPSPARQRLASSHDSAKCTVWERRKGPFKGGEECGEPAIYIWTPRRNRSVHQPMCKDCGEGTAGNYTDELSPIFAEHIECAAPGSANCADCGRLYGHEHGFPDLIIPFWAWMQISPTHDDGGLLCPSCICKRLHDAGIRCEGAFMSGPIISVNEPMMNTLRRVENIELAIDGRNNARSAIRDLISPKMKLCDRRKETLEN